MSTTESLLTHSSMRRAPLVDRFQKEWERAEQLLANGKRTQYLLGFTAVVLVAGGIWAAVVTGVPQCVVAAMTVALSIFQLFDPSKQIREQEQRLEGSLFSEVLLLKSDESYAITSSKIEVFKKFGSRCKKLDLSRVHGQDFGKVKIDYGVPLKNFIEYAIEDLNKLKANQKSKEKLLKCEELLKFYEVLKTDYRSNTLRGLTGFNHDMFNKVQKIREFSVQVQMLGVVEQGEGQQAEEAQYIQQLNNETRQKMAQVQAQILNDIGPYFQNVWSVTDLAQIITYCPNLKTVEIDAEIKEIFGQCTGDKIEGYCEAHGRYTVLRFLTEKNPCDFKNLRQIFDAEYASSLVPEYLQESV